MNEMQIMKTPSLLLLTTLFALPVFGADDFRSPMESNPISSAADTPMGNTSAVLRGYGKLELHRVAGRDEWVF